MHIEWVGFEVSKLSSPSLYDYYMNPAKCMCVYLIVFINESWLIGLCLKGKVLVFVSLEEHLGLGEEVVYADFMSYVGES